MIVQKEEEVGSRPENSVVARTVVEHVDGRIEVFVVAKSISDHAGTSIYIIDDGRFHNFAHWNFPLLQIRLEIGFEFRGECFKL